MLDSSIIETDGNFRKTTDRKKGFCIGYRINPSLDNGSIITEIEDPALRNKLLQEHERLRATAKYTPAIARMEQAIKLLSLPSDLNLEEVSTRLNPKKNFKHAAACLKQSALKLNESEKDINSLIKVGTYGRVFHALNNTAKPLREHVLLNGERTTEIDISNAQPLIMAHLLQDSKMLKSCGAGMFYEDLLEAAELELTTENRNWIKRAVLTNVIAKNPIERNGKLIEYWHGSKAEIAFKKKFPEAYDLNENFRRRNNKLAMIHRLQVDEGEVIHEVTLPMIQKEGVHAISIHDSFLAQVNCAECVGACLDLAFEEKFGIKCKVKIG